MGPQRSDNPQRPTPVVAVRNHPPPAPERIVFKFVEPLLNLAHRHQHRPLDAAQRPLVRFAAVEQQRPLGRRECEFFLCLPRRHFPIGPKRVPLRQPEFIERFPTRGAAHGFASDAPGIDPGDVGALGGPDRGVTVIDHGAACTMRHGAETMSSAAQNEAAAASAIIAPRVSGDQVSRTVSAVGYSPRWRARSRAYRGCKPLEYVGWCRAPSDGTTNVRSCQALRSSAVTDGPSLSPGAGAGPIHGDPSPSDSSPTVSPRREEWFRSPQPAKIPSATDEHAIAPRVIDRAIVPQGYSPARGVRLSTTCRPFGQGRAHRPPADVGVKAPTGQQPQQSALDAIPVQAR